jgi:hypothetical protein
MDEKFIDPLGRSNPVAALGAEQEFTSEIGRFRFCPKSDLHNREESTWMDRRTN